MAGVNLAQIGAGAQIGGTIAGGNAARRQAEFQAQQLQQVAQQIEEAGGRAASEERRKSDLMISRMLAVAGASGAGVLDPTVLTLAARTAGEGELSAQTRLYEASEEARSYRDRAAAALYEGEAKQTASRIKVVPTILSEGKSMADRVK